MELNKAVIYCMQSLRRRLRAELAVDIRLSQPDAVSAMLSACMASNDPQTRELGEHLANISDTPMKPTAPPIKLAAESADASSAGSYKVYRGQRVYS